MDGGGGHGSGDEVHGGGDEEDCDYYSALEELGGLDELEEKVRRDEKEKMQEKRKKLADVMVERVKEEERHLLEENLWEEERKGEEK